MIGAITTTTVAIVAEYCGILPPIAALAEAEDPKQSNLLANVIKCV